MRQLKRSGLLLVGLVLFLSCTALAATIKAPVLTYQGSGGSYTLSLDKGADKLYGLQLELEVSGELANDKVQFTSNLANTYVAPCRVEAAGGKTTVTIYMAPKGQNYIGSAGNTLQLGTLNLGSTEAVLPSTGKLTLLDRDAKVAYDSSVNIGRGSSGGGSSSNGTQHGITTGTYQGGSVSLSTNQAKAGERVTLTVRPDDGYQLATLRVLDKDGKEITVEEQNGSYVFTMPQGEVRVEATFQAVEHPPASGTPFEDVPGDFWAKDAIAWAYERGYVNGTGLTTFTPNGNITREQMWMILARLSGQSPVDMAAAREWAMSNGVSDGSDPTMDMPRQQMVTILYRYTQLRGYEISGSVALDGFVDGGSVADYAQEGMAWAVGNGIVGGMTADTLAPSGTATRAQFATILQRFYTGIVKE